MAMRSKHDGRNSPPSRKRSTALSPPDQTYSPPDKNTRKMPGYKPANCSEHDVISNLSTRKAYKRMTAYINQDLYRNCCTLEADNQVILWKAAVLPVKLTKTKNSTVFFYAEGLDFNY